MSVPPKVAAYRNSPEATGADMTSLSIHRCQRTAPVFRSNAARTWLAPGGRAALPDACPAGYEVNNLPPAMVGAQVSGSPSHHDQSIFPVCASTPKTVHDSVLKT